MSKMIEFQGRGVLFVLDRYTFNFFELEYNDEQEFYHLENKYTNKRYIILDEEEMNFLNKIWRSKNEESIKEIGNIRVK